MGVRFDYASTAFLCTEDNSSISDFDDFDEEKGDVGFGKEGKRKLICEKRCDFFSNFSSSFPVLSDESLSLMMKKECEFLPNAGYSRRVINGELVASVRNEAINWIIKVRAQFSFGPLTVCLSINYLDRFLSHYELPKGKEWMAQLLSVACLSLAAKMEEANVPLLIDLQLGEAKYVFESKTVQRMEILVLSTLEWRMHAVTPISFLDYFINKFSNGKFEIISMASSAAEIALIAIQDVLLMEYKPSEIAAALALVFLKEIQPLDVDQILVGCILVSKERTLKCYKIVEEMAFKQIHISQNSKFLLSKSVPQSPLGVLDIRNLSDKSNDFSVVGFQPDSRSNSPLAKKRKL